MDTHLIFQTPPPVIWSDPTAQPTHSYQRADLNALHNLLNRSSLEHQENRKHPEYWIRVLLEVDTVMSQYLRDVLEKDEFSCDLQILTDALLLPKFIDGLLYLTTVLLLVARQTRLSCDENPTIYEAMDDTYPSICVRGMSRVGSLLCGLRRRAQVDNIAMTTNGTDKLREERELQLEKHNEGPNSATPLADDNESFEAFRHCLASSHYLNCLEDPDFDPTFSTFPETQQHLISLYYFHKQSYPNDFNSVPLFYSSQFLSKMRKTEKKLKKIASRAKQKSASHSSETATGGNEKRDEQNLARNTDNSLHEDCRPDNEGAIDKQNIEDNNQPEQNLPSSNDENISDDGSTSDDNNEQIITDHSNISPSIRNGTLLPPYANFTLMAKCEHTLFHLSWSLTNIFSIDDCFAKFVTLSKKVPIIPFMAQAFDGIFTDNPDFMAQMVWFLSNLLGDGEYMCSFIAGRLSLSAIISKLALYAMSPTIDPDNPLKSLVPFSRLNFDFIHNVLSSTNNILRIDDIQTDFAVLPIFSFLAGGITAALHSDATYSWLFLQHVETAEIKTTHYCCNAETIMINYNGSPLHITSAPFNAIFHQQELEVIFNQIKRTYPGEKHVVCYSAIQTLLDPLTPESTALFELLREVVWGVRRMASL